MVDAKADLKVTKLGKPDRTVLAGDTLRYTIFVDNFGPSDARNVVIADNILNTPGEGFTLVGSPQPSQGTCGVDDDLVSCELGNIPANGRATITIEVTANEAQDINNVVLVQSDTEDPNTDNNIAMVMTSVEAVADLSVTKSALTAQPWLAGTDVQYRLSIGNAGPSTAENVAIEDALPAGITVKSVTPSVGKCTVGIPGDPGTPIQCNLGPMADEATATVDIVVTIDPDYEIDPLTGNGLLKNDAYVYSEGHTLAEGTAPDRAAETTASPAQRTTWLRAHMARFFGIGDANAAAVEWTRSADTAAPPAPASLADHSDGTFDTNSANNRAHHIGSVIGRIADLKITKFGKRDAAVRAGDVLTYTVIVDNLGPSIARDVAVKDVVQASDKFDLIDIRSDRYAICQGLPGPAAGTIVPATAWPAIPPAPAPFGVLAPTGVANVNQRLEVGCRLANDPATGTDDSLLPALDAAGPQHTGRWILTMRVRAREDQSINNIADVVADAVDPDYANNHAEVRHEITAVADLRLTKSASGEEQQVGQPGRVFNSALPPNASGQEFPFAPNYFPSIRVTAGRRILYGLTITNDGPTIAENVVVSDRLPAGVRIYQGTVTPTQGSCQTGTPGEPLDRLTCGLGRLGPGQTAIVMFQVVTDSSLAPGTVLENNAFVSSDAFDRNNRNNYAFAENTVLAAADMAVAKTSVGQTVTSYDPATGEFVVQDVDSSVTAGKLLRYQIAVQNNGPSDAPNVTIHDALPGAVVGPSFIPRPTTFLRAEGADCRPDLVNRNVLFCTVGDMPAASRRTFDIYVSVDPAVPQNTVLDNTATALTSPSNTTPPGPLNGVVGNPPILPLVWDPSPTDNASTANTLVGSVADVFVTKKDAPAEARLDQPDEPDHAVAGNEHRYRIDFGNHGPSSALGVTINDSLDLKQPGIAGETYVRCEPLDPDDRVTCSYNAVANTVQVTSFLDHNEPVISAGAGTLAAGTAYTFFLVTKVDAGYVLDASNTMPTADNSEPGLVARNTAIIGVDPARTNDVRPQNNRDTERTRIVAEADLEIAKTDIFGDFLTCDPVVRGGMITYDITVANHGPSDAAEVFVVDQLPTELVVADPDKVVVTIGGGAGEVVEVRDDGRITVRLGRDVNNQSQPELGRINAGRTAAIRIQVMVRQSAPCGGSAVNHAYVETRRNDTRWPLAITGPGEGAATESPTTPRTPTVDPDEANNRTTESTTVECPAVEVVKTVSFDGKCPGRPITVINQTGQPVTYCYQITNTGTTYLDTIRITDTLTTRTAMMQVIFTDTIRFGEDEKVPVRPGEVVTRQVTIDHLLKGWNCGKATDTVEVTANPVNSGRTDLSCLAIVRDDDTLQVDVPCAGVDWRIQLPALGGAGCETWVQIQNVGDKPTMAMLVVWGQPGFCPPQAAGPLKSECSGLLRPGSAWSFAPAGGQLPVGAQSAIVYSLSADLVTSPRGSLLEFGRIVCDRFFFDAVGDDFDWAEFDAAYRLRLRWDDLDFGAHPGEPLAVSVNRGCPDPVNPGATGWAAYTGISSDMEGALDPYAGAYMYYAPLVFASHGGLSSMLNIQNSGTLCTSLEIWFKGQDNCLRPILGDVLTVAPGETVRFDPNTVVGPDWIGSAWVRASQPLGIVVDTHGPNHFTSHVAVAADVDDLELSLGNQVNFAPLIYSEYQGWDSAIQVQNLSGTTAAKVKVYFLDRSGDIVTTLVDWICPRGSQTFFLPVIATLPGDWVGSARVESQEWWTPGTTAVDPPRVTTVVMLDKWADPARTERREAIAYNGQTECLVYDWQVGAGKGGTQSGSAVFAIPLVAKGNRGVNSEIAITNLVAKPGFTDFAIFLYDQNGLLDFVCEKLHDRQVEYIDLATWGYVPPRWLGSVVVSATFWEHEVFDPRGGFVRNLVGLSGVAVERIGNTQGSPDLPGDESKAFEAIPVFDHFKPERYPDCTGAPRFPASPLNSSPQPSVGANDPG